MTALLVLAGLNLVLSVTYSVKIPQQIPGVLGFLSHWDGVVAWGTAFFVLAVYMERGGCA